MLTDNTTVYLFSKDSCSNLSSKIELIYLCAVMGKAICLSIKTHIRLSFHLSIILFSTTEQISFVSDLLYTQKIMIIPDIALRNFLVVTKN